MTHDEYAFLKKWLEMPPRQQLASPIPANDLMQRLIDADFLQPVTKTDASNPEIILVTGYTVTVSGESAIKQHQVNKV
jgi:hypothetical protein